MNEGESHEAGLLTLLEICWQEIAVAQVREELLGPASRLGLHGPLPRAQELGLLPAVDYAGGVRSLFSSSTAAESHLKRLVLQVGTSAGTVTCSAALIFSWAVTRLITHVFIGR